MAIEDILRDALALSDDDRAKLLVALHDSFEPDDGDLLDPPAWDAAWAAEIDRRLTTVARGEMKTYSHDEAMARLRSRLQRR